MIKKHILYLFTLTALSYFMVSCKHATNFDAIPTVSYSASVAPIISSNCTFSGCHGDSLAIEFKLRNYNEVMKNGRVKAGHPETSELYETVKALSDNKIMPKKPYAPLTDDQIKLIYIWIGQGAKNN